MWLYDLIDQDELAEAIDAGLVTTRPSGDGQTIFNYTDKAQRTTGAWGIKAVRQCRGLIVDDDTETVVARPWEKFFNHGEAHAGAFDLDAPVEVTDKLDGSLGILHRAPDGSPRVATRGSFHSEQAEWATEWLQKRYPEIGWDYRLTPLVEIIYPENRIVCDYHGFAGLRLLGFVSIEWGTYYGPDRHWIAGANLHPTITFAAKTLREALALPPRKGAEGLCVRFGDNRIVKLKQADYVELHWIVTGLNERAVWQHMVDTGTDPMHLNSLLDGIPDELHAWVRGVWANLRSAAWDRWHRVVDAFDQIEQDLGGCSDGFELTYTRGEFAAEAKERGDLAPLLFMQLDGCPIMPAILKSLRPQGNSQLNHHTEEKAA